MAQKLMRVIYASVARDDLGAHGIVEILGNATRRNLTNGLCGMLIFDEGQFWQVLEGPADDVVATYARIKADARHRDVTTLFMEPVDALEFDGFSMGFPGNVHSLKADDAELGRAIDSVFSALRTNKEKDAVDASNRLVEGFGESGDFRHYVRVGPQ